MYAFLPADSLANAFEMVCYCFTVVAAVLSYLFVMILRVAQHEFKCLGSPEIQPHIKLPGCSHAAVDLDCPVRNKIIHFIQPAF